MTKNKKIKAKKTVVKKTKSIKEEIKKTLEYDHLKIEPAWQKFWAKNKIYATEEKHNKPKMYVLDMFPYPSGDGLHVGHPRGYIATDVYSRFKRMQGFNVLHPMGWDAFGLPAENYAIKNKIHPAEAVKRNILRFKKQLSIIGLSYDWSKEVDTTDPKYYKWTQWIFLQIFKKGLAYESFEPINWCPSCKTGLANEDVEDGKCERCGTVIEKKPMKQWVLKIREYADRLLEDLSEVKWPDHIKELQKNWIGRSEGAEISFKIKETKSKKEIGVVKVFTTRPDTLFGLSYVVIAPENKLVQEFKPNIKNFDQVEKYIKEAKKRSEIERTAEGKEKTGVRLDGLEAVNPVNGEVVPVFVADYVLVNYGTGSVMAVPAHDDRDFAFAKKYHLSIKEVIIPERIDKRNPPVDGKEKVTRTNVQAVVKNPKTGKYLCLHSKKFGWNTFPMGGVEEGEDLVDAAKREVEEETGYTNLKNGTVLGGQVYAEYFAKHKDQNRCSYTSLVSFELGGDEKVDVAEEEQGKNEILWIDKKDLNVTFMCHAEMDVWLQRMNMSDFSIPYTEDGTMVNSGKFDGRNNREIIKDITEFAGGKMTKTYKIQDWVFSRQRYWGEPIPVVHCEKCAFERYSKDAKLELSFYYDKVWKDMVSGKKTLETRALNPEEKDRYFGDLEVGDILKCSYKDQKTKKVKEQTLFRVKSKKIYSSINNLFNDKIALSKFSSKKYKTEKGLEESFSVFGEDYIRKIKKNGLIAWDIEPVTVVVPVPEKDLPVKLPVVKSYEPTGTGESPLAGIEKWVNTKCPVCKGKAKRETNTMPQWAGSSWYYLRYIDPKNNKVLVDPKKEKYWMPVDMYVGGAEHATRHLIYARFWHKFLYDIGVVSGKEPFTSLRNQGMILGADHRKMSKRWGNVINPDDVVRQVGADTLRVYESFMGPFDQEIAWSTDSMVGSRRFLDKVWKLQYKVEDKIIDGEETENILHNTIKKVGEDIASFNANTAISAMMILVNHLEKKEKVSTNTFVSLIKILSPFAPHVCEELWKKFGGKKSITQEVWPMYDKNKLQSSKVKMVVQINGKVRAEIQVTLDSVETDVVKMAKDMPEVAKWIDGQIIKKTIFVKNRIVNFVI